MRITCPNCGAQYEVDARVIPDMGRDVQCSNCGHTWFQRPQSAVAASVRRVVEDPPASPGPESDHPPRATDTVASDPGSPAAEAFPPISPEDGPAASAADADADVPVAPPRAAGQDASPAALAAGSAAADPVEVERPTLDDATRALLREEAEREAQARAAERRPAIETQGDFDLTATQTPSRAVQRSADLSGTAEQAGTSLAVAVAAASSRRESLPDVDTITSGLRIDDIPPDALAEADGDGEEVSRRGFRTGFLIPVLFVAAAALVYLFAPALAEAVPGLRAPLAGYVDSVNALRVWITGALSGATG
jgi:predicted Zn finger-like uncharacterized protein